MNLMRSISRKILILLYGLAGLGIGCGDSEAGIHIQVLTLPDDDPLASVTLLELIVEQDEAGNVIHREVCGSGELQLEVTGLSPSGMIRVFLNGYADSVATELTASGSSPWIHVPVGKTVDIELCFCSLGRLTAGDCWCT